MEVPRQFPGPDTLLNAAHVKRGSNPGGPGKTDGQRGEEAAAALPGRCRCQYVNPENGPGQERNAVSDAWWGAEFVSWGLRGTWSGRDGE